MGWNQKKAYRFGIRIGLLGIVVHYLSCAKTLPIAIGGVVTFLSDLSRMAIAILYLLQLQNKLNLTGKFFLWFVLFSVRIIIDLSTGATSLLIADFLILLFIYIYYHQRIPWLRIIFASFIFMTIFGARGEFRSLTWFEGEYVNLNPIRKGLLYTQLIYERMLGERKKYIPHDYEILSMRSNYMVTFARTVELTPDQIPYWRGDTYRTLFTSFLPRFLFPGKPIKSVGQEFGHRYELLHPFDLSTSYNLPIIVEMYINFGPWGVVIGMFILGLIFRIIYTMLNQPQSGEGGAIISAVIFINLFNLESDFSLIFGNIIQYIFLFYLVIRLGIAQANE